MISYYAFMGLLCLALVLWAAVALRDDSPAQEETKPEEKDTTGGGKGKTRE